MSITMPIVDSDSHVTESPDLWTKRMPGKWGDDTPTVADDPDGQPRWKIGGRWVTPVAQYAFAGWHEYPPSHPPNLDVVDQGAFDPKARLERMDEYGITAQLLYPNLLAFSTPTFLKVGRDFTLDCIRAYNDFLVEFAEPDPARLVPIMVVPFWDLDASIAEMKRAKELGHKGILFSNNFDKVGLPPIIDEHWWPFYAAAEEMGLSINFHIGFAALDEEDLAVRLEQSAREHVRVSSVGLMSNARAVADIICGRVCHEFPNLDFVSVESGIGWMPYLLESLDWHWINFGAQHENPDMEMPSYYLKRQVYGTFWFENRAAATALEMIPDNVMFGTDFPHFTSLTPGPASAADVPQAHAERALAGQSDEVQRKVLYETGARLYGLQV